MIPTPASPPARNQDHILGWDGQTTGIEFRSVPALVAETTVGKYRLYLSWQGEGWKGIPAGKGGIITTS